MMHLGQHGRLEDFGKLPGAIKRISNWDLGAFHANALAFHLPTYRLHASCRQKRALKYAGTGS